ncbi:phage holin [Alkalibacterium sp. f15]|uniref:phage holin n=1 Tax=Alkalibacterium sp. f15 TaxID=3414029 RepID=UPI003BF91D6F
MKQINWKVRLKNKRFLMEMGALILTLSVRILALFNINVLPGIEEELLEVLLMVLTVMAGVGIIEDHTTEGLADSKQALEYDRPREDEK